MNEFDELDKIIEEGQGPKELEEEVSDNSLYKIAARVKNYATLSANANLTPIGEALCNTYIHIMVSLYEFSQKLSEPLKKELDELIKEYEKMPGNFIKLTVPKKVKND